MRRVQFFGFSEEYNYFFSDKDIENDLRKHEKNKNICIFGKSFFIVSKNNKYIILRSHETNVQRKIFIFKKKPKTHSIIDSTVLTNYFESLSLDAPPKKKMKLPFVMQKKMIIQKSLREQHPFMMEKMMITQKQKSCAFPKYWDLKEPNIKFNEYSLKTADITNIEFTTISNAFHQSMLSKDWKILKIEFVQNCELFEKMQLEKKHMERCGGFETIFAFHGTDSETMHIICKFGFVNVYSRVGIHGKGTYCAKRAEYCHNFGYVNKLGNDVFQVFGCTVLLGPQGAQGFRYHHLHNWPKYDDNSGKIKDYLMDKNNKKDASMFILHNNQRIYPKCILTYKKKN